MDKQHFLPIFERKAILFVGAGFAKGAINSLEQELPVGNEFRDAIAERLGLPKTYTLEQLSNRFLKVEGAEKLWTLLNRYFTSKSIQSYHKDIVKLPWRRIYTTNYDDVLEHACGLQGVDYKSFSILDEDKSFPSDTLALIHLNGFIKRSNGSDIESSIRLTSSSYASSALLESPLYNLLRQDLEYCSAAFFVGYSLFDLDIERLLFDLRKPKERVHFFLGPTLDDLTKDTIEEYGLVHPLYTKSFAEKATEFGDQCEPYLGEDVGAAFEEIFPPDTAPSPTDEQVLDFFLLGACPPELLQGNSYTIARVLEDEVIKTINSGKRVTIIHGTLGNGKTILIDRISLALVGAGVSVFRLVSQNDYFLDEISVIKRREGKKLIVVEDYGEWRKAISVISHDCGQNVSFLLSGRTTDHELAIDGLLEIFKHGDVQEFDCSKLDSQDRNRAIEIFDRFGLWGNRAGLVHRRKNAYIADECRGEMHSLLLGVLRAPQIVDRMSQIFEKIRSLDSGSDLIIVMCICTFLQKNSKMRRIADLLGGDINLTAFLRSPAARQLVDQDRGHFRVRSSVTSQYLLKEASEPSQVTAILLKIMKRCTGALRRSEDGKYFYRELMKFSNLERILPDKGKLPAIISYYERIKGMGNIHENPHFWLQYAVACTSLDELDRAGRYFDTAKARARKSYDSHIDDQINNHYARYLMETATRAYDVEGHFNLFKRARQIVTEQVRRRINDEKLKYYPFRIASKYADYVDKYYSKLTETQKAEVSTAANFVLERIDSLSGEERMSKDVKTCLKNMEYIQYRLGGNKEDNFKSAE